MPRRVHIDDERKMQFAALYLLHHMVNEPATFPVYLEKNDEDLEPILAYLMARNAVEIRDAERYAPSASGRAGLGTFMDRYREFLQIFDVYCAVDLVAGEFAFAQYYELSEDAWSEYLAEDRWDDLRIAAAEYKGLDPVEIVFMSFIHDGRFGRDREGWQFDLLLGSVWDEVGQIVESAMGLEELGYEDASGTVSGKAVIRDVLSQGSQLLLQLVRRERRGWGSGELPDEVYRAYSDPAYVSPCWKVEPFL